MDCTIPSNQLISSVEYLRNRNETFTITDATVQTLFQKFLVHSDYNLSPLEVLSFPCSLRLPNTELVADNDYISSCFRSAGLLLVEILSLIDLSVPPSEHQKQTETIIADELSSDNEFINSCNEQRHKQNYTNKKSILKILMSDGQRYLIGVEYRQKLIKKIKKLIFFFLIKKKILR